MGRLEHRVFIAHVRERHLVNPDPVVVMQHQHDDPLVVALHDADFGDVGRQTHLFQDGHRLGFPFDLEVQELVVQLDHNIVSFDLAVDHSRPERRYELERLPQVRRIFLAVFDGNLAVLDGNEPPDGFPVVALDDVEAGERVEVGDLMVLYHHYVDPRRLSFGTDQCDQVVVDV